MFSGGRKRLIAWNGLNIDKIQKAFGFHAYTNEKNVLIKPLAPLQS